MLIEQTLQSLTDLNLLGMKQALQNQRDHPKTHDLSFDERLGLLVDYEKAYRQGKKIDRLQKAARLRHSSACLEAIDYEPTRGLKRDVIAQLASCTWIKDSFNLFITGPTGIGKSWIACALAHQACRMGLSTYYIRVPKLWQDLRLAHSDGSYARMLSKLAKIDLLILDDWGLERLTADHRRDLLDIIEDRHQLKSTLITSQVPPASWHEIINDPTLADAILDRLSSRQFTLELTGESMRKMKKI